VSPTSSRHRRANKRSTRSTKSSGTRNEVFAALAKRFRAQALATTSRRGDNHKPRPGRRPAKSGTTVPSGAPMKRINSSFGCTSPLAMQRRAAERIEVLDVGCTEIAMAFV
jgi:hypothetical protein